MAYRETPPRPRRIGTDHGNRLTIDHWQRLSHGTDDGTGHYAATTFTDQDGEPCVLFWIRDIHDDTTTSAQYRRLRTLAIATLSSMTNQSLEVEIESFFRDYNDAFIAVDIARIVGFYRFPCMTLRGDGELINLATADEARTLFQMVATSYHDEGNRSSVFSVDHLVALGTRSALTTLDWELRREDSSVIRGWRQSYNLILGADGWRIVLSTFHVS